MSEGGGSSRKRTSRRGKRGRKKANRLTAYDRAELAGRIAARRRGVPYRLSGKALEIANRALKRRR